MDTDGPPGRCGHQQPPDRPGPSDPRSQRQHSGPLGSLPSASLRPERSPLQPSGEKHFTFLQAIEISQLRRSSFRPSGRRSSGPGSRWTPTCTIMMVIYMNIPLICIIQTSGNDLFFFPEGLTALHTATMSHNAVLKELWDQKFPCMDRKTELEQRRQTHADIVKSLLLMGASTGSKVSTARTQCPVCSTVTEPGGRFCRN